MTRCFTIHSTTDWYFPNFVSFIHKNENLSKRNSLWKAVNVRIRKESGSHFEQIAAFTFLPTVAWEFSWLTFSCATEDAKCLQYLKVVSRHWSTNLRLFESAMLLYLLEQWVQCLWLCCLHSYMLEPCTGRKYQARPEKVRPGPVHCRKIQARPDPVSRPTADTNQNTILQSACWI